MSEKDNGKSSKALLEEKIKKFQANPGRFIDTDELIVAFRKLPNGQNAFLINLQHQRIDYIQAKAELDFQLTKVLHIIDEKMAQQKKVIIPKGRRFNPFRH